jgi:hypothetical protein
VVAHFFYFQHSQNRLDNPQFPFFHQLSLILQLVCLVIQNLFHKSDILCQMTLPHVFSKQWETFIHRFLQEYQSISFNLQDLLDSGLVSAMEHVIDNLPLIVIRRSWTSLVVWARKLAMVRIVIRILRILFVKAKPQPKIDKTPCAFIRFVVFLGFNHFKSLVEIDYFKFDKTWFLSNLDGIAEGQVCMVYAQFFEFSHSQSNIDDPLKNKRRP